MSYTGIRIGTNFSPLSLNPALWLDSSNLASITSSGGKVSQWNDLSPNGRHATQSVDGDRPLTGTDTINGLNALKFVSADGLVVTMNIPQPFSAVVVAKATARVALYPVVFCRPSGTVVCYALNGANSYRRYIRGGSTVYEGQPDDMQTHVVMMVFNGTYTSMWADGVSEISNQNSGTTALINPSIGKYDNSGYWTGLVAEFIVLGRALPDVERLAIGKYLKTKWGTP